MSRKWRMDLFVKASQKESLKAQVAAINIHSCMALEKLAMSYQLLQAIWGCDFVRKIWILTIPINSTLQVGPSQNFWSWSPAERPDRPILNNDQQKRCQIEATNFAPGRNYTAISIQIVSYIRAKIALRLSCWNYNKVERPIFCSKSGTVRIKLLDMRLVNVYSPSGNSSCNGDSKFYLKNVKRPRLYIVAFSVFLCVEHNSKALSIVLKFLLLIRNPRHEQCGLISCRSFGPLFYADSLHKHR